MTNVKYIGLDVHQATIAAALLDANGKLVMESVLETRASTILDFIRGVRASSTSPLRKVSLQSGCMVCREAEGLSR
ncbi:MAG TPA: hypothetical protein VFB24_14035 [Candidatus Binatia bacterium]|nr:hypothetical protein [Candidatus Binatia bacterium]